MDFFCISSPFNPWLSFTTTGRGRRFWKVAVTKPATLEMSLWPWMIVVCSSFAEEVKVMCFWLFQPYIDKFSGRRRFPRSMRFLKAKTDPGWAVLFSWKVNAFPHSISLAVLHVIGNNPLAGPLQCHRTVDILQKDYTTNDLGVVWSVAPTLGNTSHFLQFIERSKCFTAMGNKLVHSFTRIHMSGIGTFYCHALGPEELWALFVT